ncbi:hypothetical protein RB653_004957 [Dictyostelium firmibasis]|uniref:Uncharacterized protein n=1 Tax=Dictyostelium firmibasis TaxID=79012 RepID=A0AAN7UBH9_9MYCE
MDFRNLKKYKLDKSNNNNINKNNISNNYESTESTESSSENEEYSDDIALSNNENDDYSDNDTFNDNDNRFEDTDIESQEQSLDSSESDDDLDDSDSRDIDSNSNVWNWETTHTFLTFYLKNLRNPNINSLSNKSVMQLTVSDYNKKYKTNLSVKQALSYLSNLRGVNSKLKKPFTRPKRFTSHHINKYGSKHNFSLYLDTCENYFNKSSKLLELIEKELRSSQVIGDTESKLNSSQISDDIASQQQNRTNVRRDRYSTLTNIFQDEKSFRGKVCSRLEKQEQIEREKLDHQIKQDSVNNSLNSRLITQLERSSNQLEVLSEILIQLLKNKTNPNK